MYEIRINGLDYLLTELEKRQKKVGEKVKCPTPTDVDGEQATQRTYLRLLHTCLVGLRSLFTSESPVVRKGDRAN